MKLRSVITSLALFVLFHVVAAQPATAAGLIKYHIKVTNKLEVSYHDRPIACTVNVFDGMGNKHDMRLAEGKTDTITIKGPHCPARLEGTCYSISTMYYAFINTRCIMGFEYGSCFPACYNTDWVIRLHSDGIIHFDKE